MDPVCSTPCVSMPIAQHSTPASAQDAMTEMRERIQVWLSILTWATFSRILVEIAPDISASCPVTAAPTASIHSPPPPAPPPPAPTQPQQPAPPPPPRPSLSAQVKSMEERKGRQACVRRLWKHMDKQDKFKPAGSDGVADCFLADMHVYTYTYTYR